MKTITANLIMALFLVSGLLAACSSDSQEEQIVSYTEYSPGEASAWTNIDDVNPSESKILIINSDEELGEYIEGDYTSPDFSAKTLLLVYGYERYQNAPNATRFTKKSEQDYVVTVNLLPNFAAALLHWQVAIVVDKLPDGSKVKLNITRNMN